MDQVLSTCSSKQTSTFGVDKYVSPHSQDYPDTTAGFRSTFGWRRRRRVEAWAEDGLTVVGAEDRLEDFVGL